MSLTLADLLGYDPGPAICYSGYREGQGPDAAIYPSYEQIREDLLLVARHWRFLRLYDCGPHAELVLTAIRREGLGLRVLLGAWLAAEADNPGCPWGGVHGAEQLERNRAANHAELDALVRLARQHPGSVVAVAAGNEACVDWTDHLVPPDRVAGYVRALKAALPQPVTVCDNYVPWQGSLAPVAAEVDFVSIHTYPLWEHRAGAEALSYTADNWQAVANRYPGKPVIITEAGWATRSGGAVIPAERASPALQAAYLDGLAAWSGARGITTFLFEAFDEPWKGSADPLEPEKHWGLFTEGRRPKAWARALFPDLPAAGEPA